MGAAYNGWAYTLLLSSCSPMMIGFGWSMTCTYSACLTSLSGPVMGKAMKWSPFVMLPQNVSLDLGSRCGVQYDLAIIDTDPLLITCYNWSQGTMTLGCKTIVAFLSTSGERDGCYISAHKTLTHRL